MKRIAALLCALLLLPALALGEGIDIGALTPAAHVAEPDAAPTALYCGPTQGFYRHGELMLDPSEPYVYFGQHDCWAMVALGTPEAMGAVGWVEAAAIDAPAEPELLFADALPVMVEDDTFLTDEPDAQEPPQLCAIARGTTVTLLAQYGDWGYVQCEVDGVPARAFLPLSAIL